MAKGVRCTSRKLLLVKVSIMTEMIERCQTDTSSTGGERRRVGQMVHGMVEVRNPGRLIGVDTNKTMFVT
jgi:hypothetical protein